MDYIKEAQEFHELYERLAPKYGYETRADTKQFDSNSQNGQLMIEVVTILLTEARKKWVEEEIEKIKEIGKLYEFCNAEMWLRANKDQISRLGAELKALDK